MVKKIFLVFAFILILIGMSIETQKMWNNKFSYKRSEKSNKNNIFGLGLVLMIIGVFLGAASFYLL